MSVLWEKFRIRGTEPVRDPLWKNILLPAEFTDVWNHPAFIKLGRILQLGPAHLVYPGATHTRRAHSLGVFEIARRILSALTARFSLPFLSEKGARSFLVASLCHDLGHFPYAHSLKELPLVDHEELTARIMQGELADAIRSAGADPALAAAIVDKSIPAESAEILLYRSLLSGVLDPDKLDYLNRDAWACGVPYGTQDVDFIVQHLSLDELGLPGVDARGVMSVEAVLFSKYQMYKAVYWHRTVRAATSMIKKAVVAALSSGSILQDDLYGLDDAGFYLLMERPGNDPQGLISHVFTGQLLPVCHEIAFDPANETHRRAADLSGRPDLEAELSEILSDGGKKAVVIIDLPEPISFESAMPVAGTGSSFTECSVAFGSSLVSAFERSLRILRVFSDSPRSDAGQLVSRFFGIGLR